jgi:hypothetical protein
MDVLTLACINLVGKDYKDNYCRATIFSNELKIMEAIVRDDPDHSTTSGRTTLSIYAKDVR